MTETTLRRKQVDTTVESVAGKARVVRFVVSTGAVDRDNDTINPNGWDLRSYLKNPVVLWAHDYRQLPIGRATSVVVRDGRLISECEFADHPFAETVLRMLKGGFLKATSVGFKPKRYVENRVRGGIDFLEQELMEYSVVPVPANPEALVAGAKAAGIDVAPVLAWAKAVLRAPMSRDNEVVLELDDRPDDDSDVLDGLTAEDVRQAWRKGLTEAVRLAVRQVGKPLKDPATGRVTGADVVDVETAEVRRAIETIIPGLVRQELTGPVRTAVARLRGRVD